MRLRASYKAALASLALSGQPALAQYELQHAAEASSIVEPAAAQTTHEQTPRYGGAIALVGLGAIFALSGWRQRRNKQETENEQTKPSEPDNDGPPLVEVKPLVVSHGPSSRPNPIRHQPAGDKPEPVEV